MKKIEREDYIFQKKCYLILLYLFYLNGVSYKSIISRSFGFHFDPKCNFKVVVFSNHEHIHKYVIHIFNSLWKANLEEIDVMGNVNFFKVKNVDYLDPYIPQSSLNVYFDEYNFRAIGFMEGKKIDYYLKDRNNLKFKQDEAKGNIFKDDILYLLNLDKNEDNEESFIHFLLKLFTYRTEVDLVLGSGINADYGAKDWKSLTISLNEKFYEGSLDRIKEIKHYIGGELFVSSKILKTNGFDTYKELNKELYLFKPDIDFFSNKQTTLYIITDYIARHDKTTVITYNYDTNLEYILKKRGILYNTTYDDNSFLNKEAKVSIFHVHGLLPFDRYNESKFTDSLIFNESEYYYLYNNPYSWNIAKQLHDFIFNTSIFIGISLTDPNMKRLLELASNHLKFNFIFMKREEGFDAKTYKDVTNYFFTYDLITIWINDYKEINDWLKIID